MIVNGKLEVLGDRHVSVILDAINMALIHTGWWSGLQGERVAATEDRTVAQS